MPWPASSEWRVTLCPVGFEHTNETFGSVATMFEPREEMLSESEAPGRTGMVRMSYAVPINGPKACPVLSDQSGISCETGLGRVLDFKVQVAHGGLLGHYIRCVRTSLQILREGYPQ